MKIDQAIWDSPAEVLDELSGFGGLMMNEVQQRSAQLDTKLTTMLGLSGTMLAFLLIGNEFWSVNPTYSVAGLFWYRLVIAVTTALGLACVVFCYLGLKLREWIVPSESDWFKQELLSSPEEMKKFHLISMAEVHTAHNKNNAKKADYAQYAEHLLVLSAVVLGCTLLIRVIQQLTN